MRYSRLGSSGVPVSVLGLGGNTFGRSCDEATTRAVVDQALDLGVNFVDTADSYTDGLSEKYLGRALSGRRDSVVLATKTGWPSGGGVEDAGLYRRRIFAQLEASLRRLRTDYIDVFYLHLPDPHTQLEESLRAIDDLVTQGKIRYGACSNYPAWQVAEMMCICKRHGYPPIVASQSPYSPVEREIDNEVIPACQHYGVAIVAYAPLASGFLTGKYRPGEPIPRDVRGYEDEGWQQRRLTERNFGILDVLERFGREHGRDVSEVALAWVLAHPAVRSVLVGATRPEQLISNAGAADWMLSQADYDLLGQELDAVAVNPSRE